MVHPRRIEHHQRELEPKRPRRTTAQIGKAKEAAFLAVFVLSDKGAGHEGAHEPSLLAKVLGHAAHVLLAVFVPDAAVDDAELVAEAAAALVGAEAVVVDGELHDGRGVDDAAVALAEAAASGCEGLLADRDSVFGGGGSGGGLDGLFAALGGVGGEEVRYGHGFGFLSWGGAGLCAGWALRAGWGGGAVGEEACWHLGGALGGVALVVERVSPGSRGGLVVVEKGTGYLSLAVVLP